MSLIPTLHGIQTSYTDGEVTTRDIALVKGTLRLIDALGWPWAEPAPDGSSVKIHHQRAGIAFDCAWFDSNGVPVVLWCIAPTTDTQQDRRIFVAQQLGANFYIEQTDTHLRILWLGPGTPQGAAPCVLVDAPMTALAGHSTEIERYLSATELASGAARDAAASWCTARARGARLAPVLSEVWTELLCSSDSLLHDLIKDMVKETTDGELEPTHEEIEAFLQERCPCPEELEPDPLPEADTPTPHPHRGSDSTTTRKAVVTLHGTRTEYPEAIVAQVAVLNELAKRDPDFLPRLHARPEMHGSKRHYIARTPAQLYPSRPDLHDRYCDLRDGWVLANNTNNELKKTIVQVAAEVAGLVWGEDLIVLF